MVVTNAVNSSQIEEEFNQNYQPIRFLLLRDLQEVANYFNFIHSPIKTRVTLHHFTKIVNFANFQNHFASIMEH